MSTRALPLAVWTASVHQSVGEVASLALGADLRSPGAERVLPPLSGAYIPLMTSRDTVRVGVLASPEACEALARLFLAADEETPKLADADVADALCEFVNIVAGVLKRNLAAKLPALQVGLPLFVAGPVVDHGHAEVSTSQVRLGDVPALLSVARYLKRDAS